MRSHRLPHDFRRVVARLLHRPDQRRACRLIPIAQQPRPYRDFDDMRYWALKVGSSVVLIPVRQFLQREVGRDFLNSRVGVSYGRGEQRRNAGGAATQAWSRAGEQPWARWPNKNSRPKCCPPACSLRNKTKAGDETIALTRRFCLHCSSRRDRRGRFASSLLTMRRRGSARFVPGSS
jgi:hypothetical protein